VASQAFPPSWRIALGTSCWCRCRADQEIGLRKAIGVKKRILISSWPNHLCTAWWWILGIILGGWYRLRSVDWQALKESFHPQVGSGQSFSNSRLNSGRSSFGIIGKQSTNLEPWALRQEYKRLRKKSACLFMYYPKWIILWKLVSGTIKQTRNEIHFSLMME
jgi:hypothetical protein